MLPLWLCWAVDSCCRVAAPRSAACTTGGAVGPGPMASEATVGGREGDEGCGWMCGADGTTRRVVEPFGGVGLVLAAAWCAD